MPAIQNRTAVSLIKDHLGDRLNALFVVRRNPVSGAPYESFGLFALVRTDREEAYRIRGALCTLLHEHGFDIPLTVEPGTTVPLSDREHIQV